MMHAGREMRACYGAGLPDCLPRCPPTSAACPHACRVVSRGKVQWGLGLAAEELVDSSLQRLDELRRYVPTLARPDEMFEYPHLGHNYKPSI